MFSDDYGRMWLDTKDQRKKFIYKDTLIWVDRPENPARKDRYPVYYPGSGLYFTSKETDKSERVKIQKYGTGESYEFPLRAEDRLMLVKRMKKHQHCNPQWWHIFAGQSQSEVRHLATLQRW